MARFVLGWSLVGGGGEAGISAPAAAAAGHQKALAGNGEVVQFFAGLGVVDHRAHRRQDIDRFAFVTCAIAPLAMAASLRCVLGIEAKFKQGFLVRAGAQIDSSAATAVATAGTTARHKSLAAKGLAAVS